MEKELTHGRIMEELQNIKSCVYYCMADEIGKKEQTHHTHIFIACSSAVRFSTIKNRFPQAHIELARGTSEQNRDYVFKIGKYEKEKGVTRLPDSQEEYGEMPVERQGVRNDIVDLYDKIKSGASDYEILEEMPDHMLKLDKIERVRQTIKAEEFKNKCRDMEVIYIWGQTATGKTSYVLEKHGFQNVYRVSNYKNPYDGYRSEDVLLFDEYRGQFGISELLNYLDRYPLELPCRYQNKTACYTKVYIVSNIKFEDQYPDLWMKQPETWNALVRRINRFVEFPLPPRPLWDELKPERRKKRR